MRDDALSLSDFMKGFDRTPNLELHCKPSIHTFRKVWAMSEDVRKE